MLVKGGPGSILQMVYKLINQNQVILPWKNSWAVVACSNLWPAWVINIRKEWREGSRDITYEPIKLLWVSGPTDAGVAANCSMSRELGTQLWNSLFCCGYIMNFLWIPLLYLPLFPSGALLELGSKVITHVPVEQSWIVVKILVLNDNKTKPALAKFLSLNCSQIFKLWKIYRSITH